MPRDGRREAAERHVVVGERPQRLVAVEGDAVEVVRLPLVPVRRPARGRRSSAPCRRSAATLTTRTSPAAETSSARTTVPSPVGRGVEPGEAPAVCERRRDRLAVLRSAERRTTSCEPSQQPVHDRRPGQPGRRDREREQQHVVATAVSATTARSPGGRVAVAVPRLRRRPSRSEHGRGRGSRVRAGPRLLPAAHGCPAWKPPATISTSLTKSGDGGSPASAPSEIPSEAPSAGCVRAMPPTAWPAARGSCSSSGVAA